MKWSLWLLLATALANGADPVDATVRPIVEAHRWFDLRDAVSTAKFPALYRGLAAAAFNDIRRAEREFRAAIRSHAGRDQQYAAHEALFHASFRNGWYRRAAMEAKKKWALKPGNEPPDWERELVRLFEQLPDLELVSRKAATVTYTTWRGGQIVAPLAINGQAARFALDTDMNMSVITEAEARRLGMRVSAGETAVTGVTGSSAPGGHTAVAGRLQIGGAELRNVAFLVVPDSTGKFMDYPVGERGVLGLPVLLAIQTFRWNRERRLELGFKPAGGRRVANLCFDGTDPLVEAVVESRRLTFLLDTGSSHSAAWPIFAEQFPALLDDATKGSQELIGLSGSGKVAAAILPELRMLVANMPIVLRPAPVLLTTTGGPSNWHYGTIGIDLLNQAREVTLDFKAMTLVMK
jgi:predicted aspartyl protease